MTELFDIGESLSPRLKWMREHEVETFEIACGANPWICRGYICTHEGRGETEDEAIGDWANKNRIPLWNQI